MKNFQELVATAKAVAEADFATAEKLAKEITEGYMTLLESNFKKLNIADVIIHRADVQRKLSSEDGLSQFAKEFPSEEDKLCCITNMVMHHIELLFLQADFCLYRTENNDLCIMFKQDTQIKNLDIEEVRLSLSCIEVEYLGI